MKRLSLALACAVFGFVVLMVLPAPDLVQAFTCPNATTCSASTSYKEPTTNANGTAIDALKQTILTPSVNGVAQTPIVTPATAATGGGTISKTLTINAPACKTTAVTGVVVAEDTASVKGAGATASLSINRSAESGCEPDEVTNFTIN